MDTAKRKKLEAAGFTVGTADEFLDLSATESALVTMRLRLADLLRDLRKASGVSQDRLAKRIGTSQSRLAKMEAGADDVSLDLLMFGVLAAGASTKDVARAIEGKGKRATSNGR